MNKSNKIIMAIVVLSAFVFLMGCQQEETKVNKVSQETKKATGYIETLAKINKESKENIQDAVDKENKKLDETKKILEDTTKTSQTQEETINNNSQQPKAMNNDIPKQINMEFAKTCKSATLKTNKGDITIEFFGDKAPVTVANFCTLASKDFYNGLTFHRIVKDFMIQGGDPTGSGSGGPGYEFKDESPQAGQYKIGSIAMANSGPNTNGSQFFIITGDAGVSLPPLYSLFGEVTKGMDVVNAIQDIDTTMSDMGEQSVPVEKIVIESIELNAK